MKKSPFLSKSELARELGVSTRTINRWVEIDLLPKPERVGHRTVYWKRIAVEKCIPLLIQRENYSYRELYRLLHPAANPTDEPASPQGWMKYSFTKSELAALLGVSTRTINRWVESGILPEPERDGYRSIYWRRKDVEHLHELVPQD
jgi:predicted DNA-binding transcriptional regulator AlpA